jgi:GNAT superfamily N-acetyltransferase
MINQVKIRDYMPEDKSIVLDLLKLNIPEYFAESEIIDLDEYLDHKIEQYFVAETDGRIIGAGGINFDFSKKAGIISWDFIDPKFQGKGIGRQLLKHRIDLLLSMKNIKKITVRTSQLTYIFYEKNGFVLKKIVKDYWAIGFDMYEMEYTHL